MSRIYIILFFALYFAACVSPAIQGSNPTELSPMPGWVALMLGWIFPITIPWSANVLVVIGLILYVMQKHDWALKLGIAAFIVALTTWFSIFWWGLMIGYCLWQASFLAFALAASTAREAAWRRVRESEGDILIP